MKAMEKKVPDDADDDDVFQFNFILFIYYFDLF